MSETHQNQTLEKQGSSGQGMRGREDDTISRSRGSLFDGFLRGDDDKEVDGGI